MRTVLTFPDGGKNALLDSLDANCPHVRRRSLTAGSTLWRHGDLVDQVLFPLSGLIGLHATDDRGRTTQVDFVDRCRAGGLFEALSRQPANMDCRVLISGAALSVPAPIVQQWCAVEDRCVLLWREARRVLSDAQIGLICAARHHGKERLADRLLAFSPCADDQRLALNHETLASALGMTRTTLTTYAGELADQGLIKTGRGWVAIEDPAGLRRTACGCRSMARTQAGAGFAQADRD